MKKKMQRTKVSLCVGNEWRADASMAVCAAHEGVHEKDQATTLHRRIKKNYL
jgi:hypothetical protein